ncbi:hypothetical protein E4U28_006273 [Claviceps purpurea]|nr:hypothetical protein E4U28_006273 [Claviceps purpurea]
MAAATIDPELLHEDVAAILSEMAGILPLGLFYLFVCVGKPFPMIDDLKYDILGFSILAMANYDVNWAGRWKAGAPELVGDALNHTVGHVDTECLVNLSSDNSYTLAHRQIALQFGLKT